jgi:hypothetical protein
LILIFGNQHASAAPASGDQPGLDDVGYNDDSGRVLHDRSRDAFVGASGEILKHLGCHLDCVYGFLPVLRRRHVLFAGFELSAFFGHGPTLLLVHRRGVFLLIHGLGAFALLGRLGNDAEKAASKAIKTAALIYFAPFGAA